MDQYLVLGVMSGSSLDGLDLCFSQFTGENQSWTFQILETETLPIPTDLVKRLRGADELSSFELLRLDMDYGKWIGETLSQWLASCTPHPEIIGIHGHTVFHSPPDKISLQIGNGQAIAAITGIPVIDNFRTPDVLKGGQGAPLVPAGEHYLFPDYQAFVNLGGIANVAIHQKKILAWDVAPCNQVLNHFANMLEKPYDENGAFAQSGAFVQSWFDQLSAIHYFKQDPPKSLSNQWTQTVLNGDCPEPKSALHTYTEFLAGELAKSFSGYLTPGEAILFTGGGTFNNFLMQRIKEKAGDHFQIKIPSPTIVSFKEALIFGFLGLLKTLGKTNIFKSVTGAESDSVAGTVHNP